MVVIPDARPEGQDAKLVVALDEVVAAGVLLEGKDVEIEEVADVVKLEMGVVVAKARGAEDVMLRTFTEQESVKVSVSVSV